MFGQVADWLGGLLGFNQQSPEALNPMAAGYQGAEANPGRTEFAPPRADLYGRFTPEQRQQIGYGYLMDAFSQIGGRQGNAANSLMNAFDVQGGRRLPAYGLPNRPSIRVPSLLGN